MSQIESVLRESRSFPPPDGFRARARISERADYDRLYRESIDDPEAFFGRVARELPWTKPFERVLDWSGKPFARWFVGGRLNASAVCVDRHLTTARRDATAIVWEGEPGDQRTFTYAEVHAEVCRFANVLRARGIGKGDRGGDLHADDPRARLRAARLRPDRSDPLGRLRRLLGQLDPGPGRGRRLHGRHHRRRRLAAREGAGAQVGGRRGAGGAPRGSTPCWSWYAAARTTSPGTPRRDVWVHELAAAEQPDGVRARAHGQRGHALPALHLGQHGQAEGHPSHDRAATWSGRTSPRSYIFDLREDDVYWCTADVGWITGHSYIVYGPLANGATVVMYEGAPNEPHPGRFWELVREAPGERALHRARPPSAPSCAGATST